MAVPGKNAQELYDRLSKAVDRLIEKNPMMGKTEVKREAEARKLHLKSSLFSATLSFSDATIHFDAQLSLMALPFRSKFDEGLDKWLDKTFNKT